MNESCPINQIIYFLENEKINFKQDVSMKENTSFKTGGNAKLIIYPTEIFEIQKLIKYFSINNLKFLTLGNGSNILAPDDGIDYPIIKLDNFSNQKNKDNIEIIDDKDGFVKVKCNSSISISKMCSFALAYQLSGFEFAWGIPGAIGGAVYMNAGAYSGEIKNIIDSVDFIDSKGEYHTISKENLDLSYRHSYFSDKNCCILSADFKLQKGFKNEIESKMNDFMARRRSKQPLEYPSCGSTFKRPPGNFAGTLIEKCGLKGYSVGGASVSDKHAGFIINKNSAKSADILSLIQHIQKTVAEKTGYFLECELKIL